MLVTTFPDKEDTVGAHELDVSLDELAALVRSTSGAAKGALPLLKPARFGNKRNEKKSLRWGGNITAVSGIAGDYDGEQLGIDEAVEVLDKAGIIALVYTSPSYRPEAPRWRVVCPFSNSQPPGEHARMVARLNGLLGGVLGPESFVLAQCYFFGAVAGNPHHRVELVDGMTTIDLADELDKIAIGKPGRGAKPNGHAANEDPGVGESIGVDTFRAAGAAAASAGANLHYPDLLPLIIATGRVNVIGDDDRAVRREVAEMIWRATPDSGMDQARFDAAFGAPIREGEDNVGPGTFFHYARLGGWVPHVEAIRLTGGNRPEVARRGMAALATVRAPLYRRGDQISYIVRTPAKASDGRDIVTPSIVEVSVPLLLDELGRAAVWERYDLRRNKWCQIDVPGDVATRILKMPNSWPFPALAGIVGTPTLRPDGTLLTRPGYDRVTGFVLFEPPPMPPIDDEPSRDDAAAGLRLLGGLLSEFPFAEDARASRAVALSMLMTPVLRPALAPAVPLHVVKAPAGGSGKSFLADLASAIITGEVCPVTAVSPSSEETEKRLVAAAMTGRQILSLDNVNGELRSPFLCQAVERAILQLRPLGSSDQLLIPNSVTVTGNGNNIEVCEDLVRRTIMCALDADMEQPETRQFKQDPLAMILADRGAYIAAILTIARAYICAGRPGKPAPFMSFGRWSDTVRGALTWLGEADPVDTVAALHTVDPVADSRAAVFTAMAALHAPEAGFTTADLASMAISDEALRSALMRVAGERGGDLNNGKLGWWMRRNVNTFAAGFKLLRDDSAKLTRWVLAPVTGA